jgi:hypothetical protein
MSFLKKLFSQPSAAKSNFYQFAVICDRCGEQIEGRVNLANDLSADYEAGDLYRVHKVLVGDSHCFQRIDVVLTFDAARRLLEKTATGGKFVE